MFRKYRQSAFTLVELLVVIAIIGLIATLSVVALGNARAKSRDSKRVSDIKQVQTALELFFSDQGRYPTAEEWNSGSLLATGTFGTTTYMERIPEAPLADGDLCPSDSSYKYASDGDSYSLSTCLGNNTGSLDSGIVIVSPEGQSNCGMATAKDIDGNIYNTVQIGTQCWLKQNTRTGVMLIAGSNQGDAQAGDYQKYCYDNNLAICETDGGLYQWHTAMGFPYSCNYASFAATGSASCGGNTYTIDDKHQGICPIGYHIPSDDEWHTLELYLTDPGEICTATRVGAGECAPANPRLKVGGSSGFNGVIAGYGGQSGLPTRRFADGLYMSVTEMEATIVWSRYIYSTYNDLRRNAYGKTLGLTVRCLKN